MDLEKIKPHFKIIVDFLSESASLKKTPIMDAIFIFGHYDPRVARHAAYLYKLSKAPKIIISGKGRKEIPGFNSEADFYADIIIKEGVPEKDLILEKQATNSLENVIFGMKVAHENNFRPKSLIICAMPPLFKRSLATFKKQFPKIEIICSAFNLPLEELLTPSRIKRILGEFDRFIEYAQKGDIIEVNVPLKVSQAIKEIRL